MTPAPSAGTATRGEPTGPPSDSAPKPEPRPRPTKPRTLPVPLRRALARNKVVVLLFWNPRGVDDRSVKSSVDGLSRQGGQVAVFTDRTKNLARYARITAAANVSDTPTLIVIDRNEESRLATGYLDSETVEQYVVDAVRGAT